MATKNHPITSDVSGADIIRRAEQLAADQRALDDLVRAQDRAVAELVKLARGTNDVTDAAAQAVAALTPPPVAAPAPPLEAVPSPPVTPIHTPPLSARIEQALRSAILSVDDLCKEVRAPAGPVSAQLKRMRAARQIYNVGSEDRPRWSWIIGDPAPHDTSELYPLVERLISDRPFELAELEAATGARRTRVSGAIIDIRWRYGNDAVLNLGTLARMRYFLPIVNVDAATRAKAKEARDAARRTHATRRAGHGSGSTGSSTKRAARRAG